MSSSSSSTPSLPSIEQRTKSNSNITRSTRTRSGGSISSSKPSSDINNSHQVSLSKLDTKDPSKAPHYQISARRRLLHFMELIDQRASGHIHRLDLGRFGERVILFPSLLFSAWSIPLLAFFSFAIFPLQWGIALLVGCLTTLFITSRAKLWTKRFRPGLHACAHREVNIRSWEKSNAMPSGDVAQSSFWTLMIAIYTSNPWYIFLVPAVAFGRVYFACHWLGDTIVGACIGAFVCWGVQKGMILMTTS